MIIKVFNITGEYAVDQQQGQRLYDAIINDLENGAVTLDFEGVGIVTCCLFNYGIGQILRTYSPQQLNERLIVNNLKPYSYSVLKKVVTNAKHFYSKY